VSVYFLSFASEFGALKSDYEYGSVCCTCAVCLSESVLVFYKHGMQGRNLKTNEVLYQLAAITAVDLMPR